MLITGWCGKLLLIRKVGINSLCLKICEQKNKNRSLLLGPPFSSLWYFEKLIFIFKKKGCVRVFHHCLQVINIYTSFWWNLWVCFEYVSVCKNPAGLAELKKHYSIPLAGCWDIVFIILFKTLHLSISSCWVLNNLGNRMDTLWLRILEITDSICIVFLTSTTTLYW